MSSSATAAASRLCTACGLCCNGVLFHIVRLQPADSAAQLAELGMKLGRKKSEPYFKQPCSFLDDCTCTQYAARPQRCRLFACRQLQRLAEHHITEEAARHSIDALRHRVSKVEMLLLELGNTAVHLPLSERYAQVQEQELAAGTASLRRHLVTEMSGLNEVLNNDFRLEPQALPTKPE